MTCTKQVRSSIERHIKNRATLWKSLNHEECWEVVEQKSALCFLYFQRTAGEGEKNWRTICMVKDWKSHLIKMRCYVVPSNSALIDVIRYKRLCSLVLDQIIANDFPFDVNTVLTLTRSLNYVDPIKNRMIGKNRAGTWRISLDVLATSNIAHFITITEWVAAINSFYLS